MIIQLKPEITSQQHLKIIEAVDSLGYKTNEVRTQYSHYLVCVGKTEFDIRLVGKLPGVADVHRVGSDYKLVSRKWKVKDTIVDLGDNVAIRRGDLTLLAGPCSVESEEHAYKMMDHLLAHDIRIMRSMVFKPRSSPYSFRGIGIEGLRNISAEAKRRGMKLISEVMREAQVEEMYPYVDIFQVGARNSQNFNLLDALGQVDKPVLIKRGMSGTIEELLYSAEYVFANGNEKIILCERGIRTFENAYRNTFDLNAIPILKERSHLPVIADPSHAIGIRSHVEKMALAAVMAGADGVIFEVHEQPEKAFSDGQQTLNYPEATRLYENLRKANFFRKSMRHVYSD